MKDSDLVERILAKEDISLVTSHLVSSFLCPAAPINNQEVPN